MQRKPKRALWQVEQEGRFYYLYEEEAGSDDSAIAMVSEQDKADRIVQAVNLFDEFVEVLEMAHGDGVSRPTADAVENLLYRARRIG
jgi:hypothetical protein